MRCLYCGKELALLKRLTKGGEFCSEAHKQRYQEEYDRIALSRLLQAQKKASTASTGAPAQDPVAPEAPIALEEPAPEPSVPLLQPTIEAPAEPASFHAEKPIAVETAHEYAANLQPWVEPSAVPVVPILSLLGTGPALSSSTPVRLKLVAKDCDTELVDTLQVIAEENCTPAPTKLPEGAPRRPSQSRPRQVGQLVEIDVAFQALNLEPEKPEGVRFATSPEFQGSPMLELRPASIEFAAEDADFTVQVPRNDGPAFDQSPTSADVPLAPGEFLMPEAVPDPVKDRTDDNAATPHATLEALSRLHQVMQLEPDPLEKLTELVEVVTASAQSSENEPVPRRANDLIEVPLRTFSPAKKVAAAVNAVAVEQPVLLPRLKALPLRPKVGLAPADAVPKAREAQPADLPPQGKPPSNTIVEARPSQKAQPAAGPVSTRSAKAMEVGEPQSAGSDEKPPSADTAVEPSPAPPTPDKSAKIPAEATSARREPPAEGKATEAASTACPEPQPQSSAPDGGLPTFGGLSRSTSLVARLFRVKLATIALLAVGGGTAYFLWGTGKSSQKAAAASPSSSDGASPRIVIGQGEWVSGWGADSTDPASGRDITIYRPSLKLSDYRIEFQGDIEAKSMGWVFRAADPENYYAMKLTLVSTSPAPKVALFKYIVVKGHQTQQGRVPIDVDVLNDSLLKVRVDVRGPKFSTYVQGQPVDVWMDDQLKSGGVGFLNERGERGRIKSVSIRYLTGSDS